VRPDSLSGRHRTEDLKRLLDADLSILESEELDGQAAAALARHALHLVVSHALRAFLDVKSNSGLAAAGIHAVTNPRALPAVVGGVIRDKLDAFGISGASRALPIAPRYLLAGEAPRNGPTQPR